DLLVDLQPGLVGQAQVEENDVRRTGADPLQSLGTGGSNLDPVGRRGERLAHLPGDQGRVIIDEQQLGHGRSPSPRHYPPSVAGDSGRNKIEVVTRAEAAAALGLSSPGKKAWGDGRGRPPSEAAAGWGHPGHFLPAR